MNWLAYHATIRSTISGLDNLITTLWFQALTFVGASVAAINPGEELDQPLRFIVELGALSLGIIFLLMTFLYATLLQRAVAVAKQVEGKMIHLSSEELQLTTYLDQSLLGGGNRGKYLYLLSAALIPIGLLVILIFDTAGWF